MLSIALLLHCVAAILSAGDRRESFKPPLSPAEEQELIAQMFAGDNRAREKLIEHNQRLVAHIAKRYYVKNCDPDDLISIGTIGLIKGVGTFSPEKNAKLGTYVGRCIENEIRMHFRKRRRAPLEVSFNTGWGDEGEERDLESKISADFGDGGLEARVELADDMQCAREILKYLSPRERDVITLRYGFRGAPLTQRETAQLLGISRSYVSRIEKCALKKLGEFFKREYDWA